MIKKVLHKTGVRDALFTEDGYQAFEEEVIMRNDNLEKANDAFHSYWLGKSGDDGMHGSEAYIVVVVHIIGPAIIPESDMERILGLSQIVCNQPSVRHFAYVFVDCICYVFKATKTQQDILCDYVFNRLTKVVQDLDPNTPCYLSNDAVVFLAVLCRGLLPEAPAGREL